VPKATLNSSFVRSVSAPTDKAKVDYWDTGIHGFVLEVRSTGGKTYYLRYRDEQHRQHQYKVGDARSLTFEQARKAAEKLRSQVVLGESPSTQRKQKRLIPTLQEFVMTDYIPHIQLHRKSWLSTQSAMKYHILPRFGPMCLNQITQEHLMDFHSEMCAKGYATATANRAIAMLGAMYSFAKKRNVPGAEVSPVKDFRYKEENNHRERFLTQSEAKTLKDCVERSENTQLKYIVSLLLLLGCRKRELLGATWDQFDLERRTWRIPITKTGRSRRVPLSAAALDVLKEVPRYPGCAYVVPNPQTLKPYTSVYCAWDRARRQAGMPELRMHDLRHSHASFMVNAGRSIYEVAKVLGHTQIKTTQRYSHLSQETLLAAVDAAADAMGGTWSIKGTAKK